MTKKEADEEELGYKETARSIVYELITIISTLSQHGLNLVRVQLTALSAKVPKFYKLKMVG